MRRSTSSLLLALAMSSPLAVADVAPPQANADTSQSYRYLRALRAEAQKLSTPPAAQEADLRRALLKYQAALDYLATPPVRERAAGYSPMQSERLNLLIPMAEAYAKLGMKDQALTALEQATAIIWLPAAVNWLDDPGYASLRNEPRFQAVRRTMQVPRKVMGSTAITVPYKDVLSTQEKVAGLSLFWAEARRGFVHFDHVPDLDWDKTYMDYLGKVIAAPTTRDYYQLMMQLAPLLQDGHTNIYPPDQLVEEFYSRPPMTTGLVENKVLVRRVDNAELATKVHVGDEIVSIDGQPVREYAEQHVAPFVSASTPQDKALRSYSYQLLAGDKAKPVTLRLRGADGVERTTIVQRGGEQTPIKNFAFKMLPGEIAYLSLDHFESDDGVKQMQAVLPAILRAKGLVLDVRRNGGGSSNFGYEVLSYLSHEPIRGSASFARSDDALMQAQNEEPRIRWRSLTSGDDKYRSPHAEIFSGPVVVLSSAQTFSAAEDFAVAFRGMRRGKIVGEATGGSTGQPLFFGLPGGGRARICVKRDTYPDGTPFVGIGVLPDIEAHPTVASVRAGTDPVLERALEELRKR